MARTGRPSAETSGSQVSGISWSCFWGCGGQALGWEFLQEKSLGFAERHSVLSWHLGGSGGYDVCRERRLIPRASVSLKGSFRGELAAQLMESETEKRGSQSPDCPLMVLSSRRSLGRVRTPGWPGWGLKGCGGHCNGRLAAPHLLLPDATTSCCYITAQKNGKEEQRIPPDFPEDLPPRIYCFFLGG